MKTLKYIIITLFITAFQANLTAQQNEPKVLVMGVPQYLFVDGLRVDVDIRTKKPNKWVSFSPIFLSSSTENKDFYYDYDPGYYYNEEDESLLGGGLQITFRQVLSKEKSTKGFYLGYGPYYQYAQLEKRNGTYWTNTVSNGNNLLVETNGDYTTLIHKMGANCILGYQAEMIENVFADFFIGFGFRYSLASWDVNEGDKYNSNIMDYGYSGVLFVSGIRIGVGL